MTSVVTDNSNNRGHNMTNEKMELSERIKLVDKFHDLLYGGIRVKAFQKLILLDSHFHVEYPRGQNWVALKRRARQVYLPKTYSNYLSLAAVDKKEIDYVVNWLGVSERTARDYMKTLNRLNNPIAYLE